MPSDLSNETAYAVSRNEQADRSKGIALVAFATIVWATGGLFTRLLPFDLWTIVFWRGVFATLFIGLYVAYSFGRSLIPILKKTDRESVLVAISSCATIILFPAAFLETTIANAFTIIAALPFVTAAIAWLWMRERPSGTTMAASAFALLGIVIMLKPAAGGPHIGDLLAILGTISQGLLTVLIRRNPHVQMLAHGLDSGRPQRDRLISAGGPSLGSFGA